MKNFFFFLSPNCVKNAHFDGKTQVLLKNWRIFFFLAKFALKTPNLMEKHKFYWKIEEFFFFRPICVKKHRICRRNEAGQFSANFQSFFSFLAPSVKELWSVQIFVVHWSTRFFCQNLVVQCSVHQTPRTLTKFQPCSSICSRVMKCSNFCGPLQHTRFCQNLVVHCSRHTQGARKKNFRLISCSVQKLCFFFGDLHQNLNLEINSIYGVG